MSELFAAFRQHLVWGLMLWVVFFTAFTALFANGRLIAFAAGLARVLASIVGTPFRFIRRAVASILGHTADAEARYRASEQYLLNKGMLVLQAVVIVVAVGVLSVSVVVTWNALVPSSDVRRAAREYASAVETQRKKAIAAAGEVTMLDAQWSRMEQAVVTEYREARQSRIAAAQNEMAKIKRNVESSLQDNVIGTLQSLESAVAQRSQTSPDDIRSMKQNLDSIVYRNWYWVGDWRTTLNAWNEWWQEMALADSELSSLSIEDLRSAEQPAYRQAKGTKESEANTLSAMEETLREHQEAASLKWMAALLSAVGSFVTFLVFVWVAGALIEGVWTVIHIADDVHRIRQAASPELVGSASAPQLPAALNEPGSSRLLFPHGP